MINNIKRRRGRPTGFKMSQTSKDQISKSKKGYKTPQATRDKIQATLKEKNKGGGYRVGKGNFIDRRGYVIYHIGGNKYVREHRLVIEEMIDRELLPGEVVHHLNRIRHDNTPKNLLLSDSSEHKKIHNWMRDNGIKAIRYGTKNYKRLLDEVLLNN